jgi:hypothetical protein
MKEEILFVHVIVPKGEINDVWDQVKDQARRTNDEFLDENDIKYLLELGEYVLWLVKEPHTNEIVAVITLDFAYYIKHKIGRVVTCAGYRMNEWLDQFLEEAEEWARANGCSHMDMYGRKGWKKVLKQYKEECTLFRKKL